MNLPLPEQFHPALSTDRLSVVAGILLAEHFSTVTALDSIYDDGYTLGCTRFGRQKNRLKATARAGKHEWLHLQRSGYDMVFTIGGIPCRFATDDPLNPTKPAILDVTPVQLGFFDEVEDGEPCKFYFILDGGYSEASEPRVFFIGEDARQQVKCRWISDTVKALHSVASTVPEAKDVGKARVEPKRKSVDEAEVSVKK